MKIEDDLDDPPANGVSSAHHTAADNGSGVDESLNSHPLSGVGDMIIKQEDSSESEEEEEEAKPDGMSVWDIRVKRLTTDTQTIFYSTFLLDPFSLAVFLKKSNGEIFCLALCV